MGNKLPHNKKDLKQSKKNSQILDNAQKRKIEIIVFSCSIILLLLVLFGILKINTRVKSETEDIMSQFYNYYESDSLKVIYYYNSNESSDKKCLYEQNYLLQLKKDYDFNYLEVDVSKLNSKNREEIESLLGIEGKSPTIAVVKNKNIIAVQEGFIESHNLVEFLIDAKILKEGSKFSQIDNLKFIDYKYYKKILDNKEDNIVVVGQAGCEYCIAVKPILNNLSKAYKIKINYLDVSDMDERDLKEFFDNLPDLGYDNEKLKNDGTFSMPTMLIVKNGKITSYLEESKELEDYVSFLKEEEIIE